MVESSEKNPHSIKPHPAHCISGIFSKEIQSTKPIFLTLKYTWKIALQLFFKSILTKNHFATMNSLTILSPNLVSTGEGSSWRYPV